MREHFTGTLDLSSIILGQVKPKNIKILKLYSFSALHSTYKKESENPSPPVINI